MLAAGKGLEPFWNIYQQHFGEGAAEAVAAHLDRMRVGNLVPSAAELAEQDAAVAADDPFAREPAGRHPSLKVWSKRAFNAESPTNLIGDTWVTLGLYPIVTLQYSSTTLYQVSYHIR